MTFKIDLKRLYYSVRYFSKHRKFKGFNKHLSAAILKQEKDKLDLEVEQIILKHRINKYMRKYLKADAKSKYIPKDVKNLEESRQQVLAVFGNDMLKYRVGIKNNLELCTL